MASAIQVRRFDSPDDKLDMKDAGGIDIVRLADGTAGSMLFSSLAGPGKKMRSRCLGILNHARCATPAIA
ncbi:MAG TPA: hypothetical protein VFQ06_08545 [Nitrospira sp.]|nr:hypothetical protein [Nitrospira sp.]